jgi:hypothetical protein
MVLKNIFSFILTVAIASSYSCKAKKCPNFEGDGANHHVKYGKGGLVKKKGPTPQRSWGNY